MQTRPCQPFFPNEQGLARRVAFFKEINDVYNWFEKKLSLIYPNSKYPPLIHRIKNDPLFNDYANKIVYSCEIGFRFQK